MGGYGEDMKNIIAIVGATGAQGGGLARAILNIRIAPSRCAPW